jgi:hypothetical protein
VNTTAIYYRERWKRDRLTTKAAIRRASVCTAAALVVLIAVGSQTLSAQQNANLDKYFSQNIGLNAQQIASIRSGQPVTKALPSRTPDEVFLFGAVYVRAAPERYLQFAHDYNRLRKLPNNLALGVFSNPPTLADLKDFTFDDDDIKALKGCKSGNCLIQIPEGSIEELQTSINWSAGDVSGQVNQKLQEAALQRLLAYQRDGNRALGVYVDKPNPTDVSKQFAYMVEYSKALPTYLPDFYRYLLDYPDGRPANVENSFYWARVKFGLKPTLRVVHVVTMRGNPGDPIAYAIAEKQLYSSHYFETALDLSFCVRDTTPDPKQSGFYLIMVMGSEQAGLTGAKGSIVRRAAVGRSVSNLQNALTTIKNTLEAGH